MEAEISSGNRPVRDYRLCWCDITGLMDLETVAGSGAIPTALRTTCAIRGGRSVPGDHGQSGLPDKAFIARPYPRKGTRRDNGSWTAVGGQGTMHDRLVDEGRDAALFNARYPGVQRIHQRPLPAGELQGLRIRQALRIDDAMPGRYLGQSEGSCSSCGSGHLPRRHVAEAFFDPVTDGDAVGTTTTVGIIKYESGEVSAALTSCRT